MKCVRRNFSGEDGKARRRRRKRRGEILGNIISLQHRGGGDEGFHETQTWVVSGIIKREREGRGILQDSDLRNLEDHRVRRGSGHEKLLISVIFWFRGRLELSGNYRG